MGADKIDCPVIFPISPSVGEQMGENTAEHGPTGLQNAGFKTITGAKTEVLDVEVALNHRPVFWLLPGSMPGRLLS